MLRTALAAKAVSTIQPRPEFKAKARYEFQTALRDMANKKSQRQPFFSWHWQWQSGWAIAMVPIIVVVLAGGGTVAAASNSMPDNALYPVKLATEQVQLAVTPSDIGKAELNAKFADRRADEIVYMASKGDAQEVQIVARRLNTNVHNITNLANEGRNKAIMNSPANRSRSVAESNPTPQNDQPMRGVAAAPAPAVAPPAESAPPVLSAPVQGSGAGPAAVPNIVPTPDTKAPAPEASIKAVIPAPQVPPAFGASQSTSDNDSAVQYNADSSQNGQNTHNTKKSKSSDREKLKQIIINNFNTRQSRLDEALRKATPQARPAVRQAIAQSQAEYENAIKALEQDGNNN